MNLQEALELIISGLNNKDLISESRLNFLLDGPIRKCLEAHDINKNDFLLIKSLVGKLPTESMNNSLLILIVARERSDIDAFELQEQILNVQQRDEASELRSIWKKILYLNREKNPYIQQKVPVRAKEKWRRIANMFCGEDADGQKITGLSLKQDYWAEGYAKGKQAKNTWKSIWCESRTNLSFIDWCDFIGVEDKSVDYYEASQRGRLNTFIANGCLKDNQGEMVNTLDEGGNRSYFNCVVALDKKLYLSNYMSQEGQGGAIHHSSIVAGAPVIFAGELMVLDGQIEKISMRSGHYKPTEKALEKFLTYLEERGIELSNIEIYDGGKSLLHKNAHNYLHKNLTDESICANNRF